MCDNTAVSWSEASSERLRIQVDTQQALTKKLLENMVILRKAGYPEVFLQGMQRAVEIISNSRPTSS